MAVAGNDVEAQADCTADCFAGVAPKIRGFAGIVVVFAGRSRYCSEAVVEVPLAGGVVNARAVQWARWSQYSGGQW